MLSIRSRCARSGPASFPRARSGAAPRMATVTADGLKAKLESNLQATTVTVVDTSGGWAFPGSRMRALHCLGSHAPACARPATRAAPTPRPRRRAHLLGLLPRARCGAAFDVGVVSPLFEGKMPIARHRMVRGAEGVARRGARSPGSWAVACSPRPPQPPPHLPAAGARARRPTAVDRRPNKHGAPSPPNTQIHDALGEDMGAIHALSIKAAWTPAQQQKQQQQQPAPGATA